jgi:hypothetical protein
MEIYFFVTISMVDLVSAAVLTCGVSQFIQVCGDELRSKVTSLVLGSGTFIFLRLYKNCFETVDRTIPLLTE